MRPKFTWLPFLLWLCAVLGQPPTATAITYGEADGDGHPYVGMALVLSGGVPLTFCSGTLIAPTVFLTAAHCVVEADEAQISFATEIDTVAFVPEVTGTPFAHPDYDDFASFPDNHDVGIVVLDEPVYMDRYGMLPYLGVLDDLATERGRKDELMTLVGYGLTALYPFTPLVPPPELLERRAAESMLVNLRSALTDGYNVQTSGHPGKGNGDGGICLGDSGGPLLLDDTDVVVGIISFGPGLLCRGVGFHTRVDIESSLSFIESFLP